MKILSLLFLIVPLLMLSACSTNENYPMGPENEGGTLKLTVTANDIYYISLSKQSSLEIADPLLSSEWDLSIENLTTIGLNGGTTAPGSVYAYLVDGIAFEDLIRAPESMYLTDDQNELYIGDNWYFYDSDNHTVKPLDPYYVIRAMNGQFYKFKITDVAFPSRYNGELTIKIEKLDPPATYELAGS